MFIKTIRSPARNLDAGAGLRARGAAGRRPGGRVADARRAEYLFKGAAGVCLKSIRLGKTAEFNV